MESPMREVAFSQTHRRTHRRRHIVVSQFNDTETRTPGPGEPATRQPFNVRLAWRYIMQTGDDGPWTTFRRVAIAADASDDEVVKTVVRYLAGPGWDRDPAVAPVV